MKIKPKKIFIPVFLGFVLFAFMSCSSAEKISNDISSDWKICFGDSSEYASRDYDDSEWTKVSSLSSLKLPEGEHYVWVRKNVQIPSNLKNVSKWFGYRKSNTAAEVYADGSLIGVRGCFPPEVNVRTEKTMDFVIPENAIHDGKVLLALKIYCPGDYIEGLSFRMDNLERAEYVNISEGILNQRFFIVFCFLCLFFCFYSLAEFLYKKKAREYLYFALCLFFIVIYFFDLGAENVYFPYNIQRAFARSCLPISLSFLCLFYNTFFQRKHEKPFLAGVIVVDLIIVALYMVAAGHDKIVNTLFLIMLVTVLATLAYGYVTGIKALKKKQFGAAYILTGLSIAAALATHDIIFQILGIEPVLWLQGFAFFGIDLSLFITVFVRSNFDSKQVEVLAEQTKKQSDKLSSVFENAKNMAGESVSIAKSLNESVNAVASAAENSKDRVEEINEAIRIQDEIRKETAKTVENLTEFLNKMSDDFNEEVQIIGKTAQGTKEVLDGMQAVGDGIYTAAQFTSTLTDLTMAGSQDMRQLLEVMDNIQKSSKEILGVVTTLDDFAQQTDLLAMNASIEAAHSGEAGKGFAVIAHEIKDLASKTSQWSAKIGEIITSVIGEIKSSVELSNKVNAALAKIKNGAKESAEKVLSAANGMENQQKAGKIIAEESAALAQGADDMQKAIHEQSEFAALVMGNMEKLFDASQAVNSASDHISDSSVSLTEQAKSLKEMAARTNESAQDLMKLMED